MFSRPVVLAAFVAIGLLGTSARADLTITVQEDAGAVQVFTMAGLPTGGGTGTAAPFLVTTPDYAISFLSGLEKQDVSSRVLGANTSISNTTGASGHTLHITITGTGFTAPNTPPSITALSHIGGTVALVSAGSTNTLTFTSSVPAATFVPPGFTGQTPAITTVGSFSNDQPATITGLSGTFAISQSADIVLNALGDEINFSTSTTLSSVPEPSSMALAGLGALGLIGYGPRRKRRST